MSISKQRLDSYLHTLAFALFCMLPLFLAMRAVADIAVCSIAALFMVHCILAKNWQWLRQPAFRMLLILWVLMLLVSFIVTGTKLSIISALIWGRFIPFLAAASTWLLVTPRALTIVYKIGLTIIFLFAIDTTWQYFTGMSLSGRPIFGLIQDVALADQTLRLTGPLTNPNIGNLFLKTGLPLAGIALYSILESGSAKRLWLAFLFAAVILSLILVSGERSISLLMLLGLGSTWSILLLRLPHARRWIILLGIAWVILFLVIGSTQHVVQQRGHFLVEQLGSFWTTPYGQLYREAFVLWRAHPVFGIGAGQFRLLSPDAMHMIDGNYFDMHPHNMYLELLVSNGLIGFSLFVLAIGLVLRQFFRECVFSGNACIPAAFSCGTLATLLFPIIVTQSIYSNWPGILFWYALGLALCAPRIARAERRQ